MMKSDLEKLLAAVVPGLCKVNGFDLGDIIAQQAEEIESLRAKLSKQPSLISEAPKLFETVIHYGMSGPGGFDLIATTGGLLKLKMLGNDKCRVVFVIEGEKT